MRIDRQLQFYRDEDLYSEYRERLGAVTRRFGHFAKRFAAIGGCAGLSQVTLTKTFTSVVPLLVHLSAGGITFTASACYPNNS